MQPLWLRGHRDVLQVLVSLSLVLLVVSLLLSLLLSPLPLFKLPLGRRWRRCCSGGVVVRVLAAL